MPMLALLLLAVVPILAWRYAGVHMPTSSWMITGAALGTVISPLSLGLYATFFLFPVGLPTGLIGLVSLLFHGEPGYEAALWLGLVPSHQIVSGVGQVYVELFNGVFWCLIYGFAGFIVDRARFAYLTRHE
jgi:hypothetical protein